MYYIFNEYKKIVGWCDLEPSKDDLNSRNEFFVECKEYVANPLNLIVGKYGSIFEPATNPKTEDEILEENKEKIIKERDKTLSETDWIINRHLEQKMLNLTTSLSDIKFNEYLVYRQELRDITSNVNFPHIELPAPPETK